MNLVIEHLEKEIRRAADVREDFKADQEGAQRYYDLTNDSACLPEYEEQLIKAIGFLKTHKWPG